jgi:hypothetical protein
LRNAGAAENLDLRPAVRARRQEAGSVRDWRLAFCLAVLKGSAGVGSCVRRLGSSSCAG